ncbi:RNA polymerase sigma factor [Actinomadura hibisca]|uniref:RNA polymerase sigma factor n=1 Tax=Actinomadura hibisca TaxID=68565 RepID=UPI000835EA61|nr:RNA polymerase sigma factor [Actinomadura hibisca]
MTAATSQRASDAAIIRAALREPEDFAALFDRYYTMIHGYAARRLGASLADDVAAETFLVAFDRRASYDLDRPDARPWLYGIASNLIARHGRAEVRLYRALTRTGPDAPADSHADRVAGRVDAQAVRGPLAAALADLAPGDRDVLLLVAWGGLSLAEAAQALAVPAGTARSRMHRARKKIRAALGDSDPTTLGEDPA